ncbi:hypothetical protein HBN50_12745 [Halobacteriovorax sp. GB3]|uniref:hypothetical protein n=1 Tax=Halobacteriovorax sp. GB3 TaxID=2719615 RepID=UPI002360416B|nr:hypothetical protein [Halobacteriovorax sp. GB3]MDD0853973.1 hypothetical protein [Halobacteriovorax sp. GB3]
MIIECPVSLGELVDKISILRIKQKNISDESKLELVSHEEKLLSGKLFSLNLDGVDIFLEKLVEINSLLWKIEDDIREKERAREFDQEFIDLARSVYMTNDKRYEIKNELNLKFGSNVKEVKSYEKY